MSLAEAVVLPRDEIVRAVEGNGRNSLIPVCGRAGNGVGDPVLGTDHGVDHDRVSGSLERKAGYRHGHLVRGNGRKPPVELAAFGVLDDERANADEAAVADRPTQGAANALGAPLASTFASICRSPAPSGGRSTTTSHSSRPLRAVTRSARPGSNVRSALFRRPLQPPGDRLRSAPPRRMTVVSRPKRDPRKESAIPCAPNSAR